MVALPEARKVSARRRHVHEYFRSCGTPAAGPRHGGRPARPPHNLAAARAAAARAFTTRNSAAAAAAARHAAPTSLWRTRLETQNAFRATPRLRQRLAGPTPWAQIFAFIFWLEYDIVVNAGLRQSDDGAAVAFDVLDEQCFVEQTWGAGVWSRATGGRRRRGAGAAGLGRARAGLAYLSAQRRHP